ncbi:MAG: hypothetical protein KatS3mg115_1058 [Candidatus Poribacteria bacterium]|nr:MAG: hypothetical protein KatS3mg115_1058 [Candidatus Poribacteria bacterium]
MRFSRVVPVSSTVCTCRLPERLEGIEPANARERGFVEVEVIHFPEYRSVIYRCVQCNQEFEGWYEGGGFQFRRIEKRPASLA